ncbi:hypothetical protein LNL84_08475 [Vibrio sp. ZSDZ34]|jgi:hypothetical protein|uniref:Lipoprotein n=1 Tax=Vibrio gelatinilyticus TaxID=2893468 RepID=A0A9X2AW54_9VIBR|nr:hypothetical protein [Vibrio gelatinilyticus]MCJ2376871.1 hypothetical protein [Vibrio gelatinilyticus]
MKKAAILLTALTLTGCLSEDMQDILNGETTVFTVSGARFDGTGTMTAGYYSLEHVIANSDVTLPNDMPQAGKEALTAAGVETTSDKMCGTLDTSGNVCFKENDSTSCLPDDISMLGLEMYKISLTDIEAASEAGFYPKVASDLGGAYIDLGSGIETVNCDDLN